MDYSDYIKCTKKIVKLRSRYCVKKYRNIESHEDRISDLSDDVISNILSNLTTKDAVLTCVLSRNWENKWTSIYNIGIHDEGLKALHNGGVTRFITFVDEILFTCKSTIRSFHLVCERGYDKYHLVKWISKVLRRQVQNLEIRAHRCRRVDLPRCLSSSTSLIKLNLFSRWTLRVPVASCFQNLKSLGLHHAIILNEQSLNKSPLVLSFPVLEDLQLRYCTWSNASSVEIRAPALLTFEILNHENSEDNDCQFKIYGSKLKRFESSGGLLALFDMCAPSVSYVRLYHETGFDVHGSRPYTILKSFPFLSKLVMTGYILKALVRFKPATAPVFGCLRVLRMFDMVEVKELMGFLQLTPNLKVLVLNLSPSDTYDGEQVITLPTCMISSLQMVVLQGFYGTQGHVAIGKFFWENAETLEKFVIPDNCTEPMVTSLRSTISKSSNCILYLLSSSGYMKVPRAG